MMCIAEIDEVWPRIASVVSEMVASREIGRMLAACRSGSAMALACDEAVVILALRWPESELEVHVWAAVGKGQDLTRKYFPCVQHVARGVGAHRITFSPRRRGWPRLLRRLGANWQMRADGMCVMEV